VRSYLSAKTSYLKTVIGDGWVRVTNYRFIGPVLYGLGSSSSRKRGFRHWGLSAAWAVFEHEVGPGLLYPEPHGYSFPQQRVKRTTEIAMLRPSSISLHHPLGLT